MRTIRLHLARAVIGVSVAFALIAATAGAAAASSPPSAVTGPPSAIAVNAATLSGNVDPNGTATTSYFQYGTTTSFGLRTSLESAGAGAHTVAVSSRVGGLTPGTTYHYRVVATNGAGTALGTDVSFKTPALAPTIVKETFSVVRDASAQVDGVLVPNGLSTTWYVRYGTTTSYGASTARLSAGSSTGDVSVKVTLGKLASDTEYHFQLVATNAAGSTFGGDATFSTTGRPLVVAQSFSSLTPTTVELTGSVVPAGHSTTWYFQYGTTSSYGLTTKTAVAGSGMIAVGVAKLITGLAPNTTYHFRLVAKNGDGTVAGADATFTTPGPTIRASSTTLTYGRQARLSGTVPAPTPNEMVSLYAQPATGGSFALLTTLLTNSSGSWTYIVKPKLSTTYKAMWKVEVSSELTIGVVPAVTLSQRSGDIFVGHVTGERSFAGKVLRLQRLVRGTWRNVAATRLSRSSTALFHPALPSGRYRFRAYFTAWQAGAGYLAGTSAQHIYRVP